MSAGPAAAPERLEPAQGRLRRLNNVMMLPLLGGVGVLTIVLDSRAWWHAVVLGAGVVAAIVAFERWAAGDLRRVALPCVAVAVAVWPVGSLAIGSRSAFFAVLLVGSLLAPQLPRHRAVAAVALTGYVAAVGAVTLLTIPDPSTGEVIGWLVAPACSTAAVTGLMFPNKRFYDVVADLEASRQREADLAVARERARFASELHDIQGHTLHVVKLKVALARKLLHTDLDRADDELREVHALVADTITQTKELAYAQRRLNLSVELENAKNLFEAAGIDVRVDRRADVEPGVDELLGQVLRETTTNVLRHAQAGRVAVTLTAAGITIVNDGAPDGPLPELRGLAVLRERLAGEGGDLVVTQRDGRFTTAATLPRPAAAATPVAVGATTWRGVAARWKERRR